MDGWMSCRGVSLSTTKNYKERCKQITYEYYVVGGLHYFHLHYHRTFGVKKIKLLTGYFFRCGVMGGEVQNYASVPWRNVWRRENDMTQKNTDEHQPHTTRSMKIITITALTNHHHKTPATMTKNFYY